MESSSDAGGISVPASDWSGEPVESAEAVSDSVESIEARQARHIMLLVSLWVMQAGW